MVGGVSENQFGWRMKVCEVVGRSESGSRGNKNDSGVLLLTGHEFLSCWAGLGTRLA